MSLAIKVSYASIFVSHPLISVSSPKKSLNASVRPGDGFLRCSC